MTLRFQIFQMARGSGHPWNFAMMQRDEDVVSLQREAERSANWTLNLVARAMDQH